MISRRQIISRGSAVKQSSSLQQQQVDGKMTKSNGAVTQEDRKSSGASTNNQTKSINQNASRTNNMFDNQQQHYRTPHNMTNFNSNDSNHSSDGYAVNRYEEYGFADDDLLDDDELHKEHDYDDGVADDDDDHHLDRHGLNMRRHLNYAGDKYGSRADQFNDEHEIEHDYEDGELGACDEEDDRQDGANEDPYGRLGDFHGRYKQESRNFYWQQQQVKATANKINASRKQQAQNIYKQQQQLMSQHNVGGKQTVLAKQRALANPNKSLGPLANSSSDQSSSTTSSSSAGGGNMSHYQRSATNNHTQNNKNNNSDATHQQQNNSSSQNQLVSSNSIHDQQQFDPYEIYAEDEDVWYSEERLLEDHLEEIFNKWRLLDDDIWCKLIIMERNRRIGKAYARVPVVTIDGSHELSYDGFKLALNGFHNPDRDSRTEECRRRIGKGIRIKMDTFGNILIKRLSKANIYVKEWLPASGNGSPPNSLGDSSSAGSSSVAHAALSMNQASCDNRNQQSSMNKQRSVSHMGGDQKTPSRQQVIKNQHLNDLIRNQGLNNNTGNNINQLVHRASMMQQQQQQSLPNDSAICDEVISVGGRLELDKIYVMFDMKKFQANINQELCRPFPDKRKLEQQCFSIVGLGRDSDDVLNLPCWLMVINIVAIEVLNERFKLEHTPPTFLPISGTGHRDSSATGKQPNFVSIFDQQTNAGGQEQRARSGTKEEDPYSLPANASSSDLKSSINDGYGTTSTKYQHIGRDYNRDSEVVSGANKPGAEGERGDGAGVGGYSDPSGQQHHQNNLNMAMVKVSRGGPRGPADAPMYRRDQPPPNHQAFAMRSGNGGHYPGAQHGIIPRSRNHQAYNNSTSIYSPGHMLVLPPQARDGKPPKLPPRDFTKMAPKMSHTNNKLGNSSSTDISKIGNGLSQTGQLQDDAIYSVGLINNNIAAPETHNSSPNTVELAPRVKSKKNRFLESLKAPLMSSSKTKADSSSKKQLVAINKQADLHGQDLITSSTSSSCAVNNCLSETKVTTSTKLISNGKSEGTNSKKASKNSLKSFLGVKSSSSTASSSTSSASAPRVTKKTNIKKSLVDKNASPAEPISEGKILHSNGSNFNKHSHPEPEVDSVVDSNEDQSSHPSAASRLSSFNDDLDIPTPDYETDENNYTIGNQLLARTNQDTTHKTTMKGSRTNQKSHINCNGSKNNQDDLYYSGYGAHISSADSALIEPSCCSGSTLTNDQQQQQKGVNKSSGSIEARGGRENSRFTLHNKMLACSSNRRPALVGSSSQLIYGSTLGLPASVAGSCGPARSVVGGYRSGSMQRCSSQQRFPAYSSSHSTSAGYQAVALGSSSSAVYQQQHELLGQRPLNSYMSKYTSGLHPAQVLPHHNHNHQSPYEMSQRFRDDPIYGRAGDHSYASHHNHIEENPYAMSGVRANGGYASSILGGPMLSHYQQRTGFLQQQASHQHRTRRRSLSRLGYQQHHGSSSAFHQILAANSSSSNNNNSSKHQLVTGVDCISGATPNCCSASNYDIGRSSSGIYGNNSSSSSSDYADWQPQMRKVNSSGYLNSVFKNHHLMAPKHQQSSYATSNGTEHSKLMGSNGDHYRSNNKTSSNDNINRNNNNNQSDKTYNESGNCLDDADELDNSSSSSELQRRRREHQPTVSAIDKASPSNGTSTDASVSAKRSAATATGSYQNSKSAPSNNNNNSRFVQASASSSVVQAGITSDSVSGNGLTTSRQAASSKQTGARQAPVQNHSNYRHYDGSSSAKSPTSLTGNQAGQQAKSCNAIGLGVV